MYAGKYRFSRRAEVLGKSVYDHAEGAIMLSVGSAYPPILPDLSREASDSAKAYVAEVMQYGPLMGLADLREAISDYVAADGVKCTPNEVLITNGAKHATDLACRVFTEPGDKIIVTAPTYMTTLQCLRSHGLTFVAIPQDKDGMRTDILAARLATMRANGDALPKLLFDVPDFHNPTGITMSLERRKALLALAEEYDFVLIEDDPYRRIRFEGDPVPPIKSMDTNGRVIAVGTVSKILAPGLRVGWAIGPNEIVRRMAMQKADGGSCPFTQRLVVDAIRSNKLAEHIDLVTDHMRVHRDTMIDALAEFLPDAQVRRPNGGYFLWAELPEGVSGDALAEKAVEHGVEIGSGRLCFPNEDPGNFIRFSYSYVDPNTIREGIRRLGEAYRNMAIAA
ncbi:PLP-dependent aminotransferase family protein [Roseibium sp. MMSF_3544]|uniref:aminotransferase-like domain-containing protein n=1 Tax=unclassified Roseibium TaxID=2629323 RepID=UPI00273E2A17|nr:PLP-dependent aminotransferase family protein [Roseibium sp. MMSF_3544]